MGKIYIIYFELSSDSSAFKEHGYAGAFVSCVVLADDILQAIEMGSEALAEDGYKITEIEKAIRFDRKEWSQIDDIVKLADQVESDGEVRYSDFDVWGH